MYKKIANCSLADKCLECCKPAFLFNSSNKFSKTCLFSLCPSLNLSLCPSSNSWTHCGQENLELLRGALMYQPDSEWTTVPAAMQVTEPITCIRRQLRLIEVFLLLCKSGSLSTQSLIWQKLLTVFPCVYRCIW